MIDDYRRSQGLKPLREDVRLMNSSRMKAEHMVREGYFGHTDPEGVPFKRNIEKVRYRYLDVREVIAKGCETEQCVLDLWLGSSAHHEIITGRELSEIGCGSMAAGGEDHFFVVCQLARPLGSAR
jgi:uncharacterized protein YkwD